MGRSKFPGKPSKSINRKRISVLQLEDEANQAAESQQPPAESQQPSGSGSGSPGAREKGNNCDNDEDDNAPGGATISGNTASSSSATSSSGNSGNGSSSGSGSGSSGSGSTNGGGVNGGTHHKSAANLDKEAVTKDHNRDSDKPKAAASRSGALPNESATSVKSSAGTSGKLSGKSAKTYSGAFSATSSGRSSGSSPDAYSAASSDGASSGISSGKSTGTTAVKSSETSSTASTGISSGKPAGTTTAKTAATGTCSSGKSSKASSGTTCEAPTSGLTSAASLKALSVATPATSTGLASALASPGGSSPGGAFAISAALLRARKNSNKKFKNLNLARGEIMLPSTSKLKQLNCPVVDSPTTTTNASASGSPPSTEGIPSIGGVPSPGEDVSLKRVLSEMPNEVASEAASSICPAATNGATQGKGAASTGTPAAGASDGGSSPKSGSDEGPSTASTAAKQKKTVTFRNVLETSDDKSVVKRSYNPDIRIPIVSIMKKDSMNRPPNYSRGGECIVRPSILSKILNKNSNIDKLNSLKFRSVPASSASLNQESGSVSGSSPNVFGLSRAFGAPMDEDDEGGVTFRRNNSPEDQNNEEDEEMDEDEDDEEVEEEEENEPEDNDEAASEKSAETEKSTGSEERDPEEKQLVMDSRFVLPKRSTRSSRIIKPNKRLLEEGAISSRKPTSSGDSKAKNLFSAASSSLVASASTSSSSGCLKLGKESFCSFGSLKTNSSSGESFVLRPPRLQFQAESKQGPFNGGKACPTSPSAIPTPVNSLAVSSFATLASPNTSSTSGTTTLSVCSVCSATVSSKEVAQARKYSVVACDVCRKFISKMTKKSISATSSSANASSVSQHQLQCKGSEGSTCSIHSAKGQLKNSKKFYKDRCTACWLKKCMISFQLPAAHRSRLSAILPPGMRGEASSREDKSAELLSPTANLRFTASASSISSSVVASASVKWKSSSDSNSALTSIKSNPLAENNVTFGSTPLLRPAILEKPLFLKISNAADQKLTSTEGISPSSSRKTNKQEKEKTKEQEQSDKPLSPTLAATKKSAVVELVIEAPMEEAPQTSLTAATVAHAGTSNGTSQSVSQPEANGETNGTGDTLKRQRIDLKGPRVKHVCRSASIVLGQPLATFGEDQQPEEEAEVLQEVATPVPSAISEPAPEKPTQIVTDENDNCASCKTPPLAKESKPFKFTGTNQAEGKKPTAAGKEGSASTAPLVAAPAKVTTRNAAVTSNLIVAASKKQRNGDIVTSSSVTQSSSQTQGRRAKEQRQPRTLISIDFWENYDPAEVCQTGFGLIVTETVAQRALCFLCGSTGLDPLIFCACCCEPYHQYCVQDEYNLKHGSFEDTTLMGSLLETTVNTTGPSSSSLNQLTQRLNWLCPRCTVCYTCNMSSGSKVKCQKCQKNYHSTCLGTSKRLLGADRPLICVNCLKCKSCSTTKVSKFVGNLPMCTGCFKLRKKGNFCPICQRCYDDNDFDLKMMECGDCSQWVHSKCEGLSDEQYNLLSTLPESIEFICKKCARRNESSRIKAEEWRQAVMEEFKASLYSVLKLLSKSRQACALLKLSPRKKMRCTCGASTNQGKLQPKALQFSSGSDNGLGSDGESQNSDDVYEFKEQQQQQKNLNMNKSRVKSLSCSCQQHISHSHSFSLVDIKQKIAGNSYVSLAEFNYDMSQVIQQSNCDELDIAYKELLSEQFPWFQNETKACTDALEEDMFESCSGTNYEDLQDGGGGSSSVYNEHSTSQAESRSGVLDIPLEEVDDLGSSGIKMRLDTRVCLFCRKSGEGLSGEEARLLYCGHDCWVHTNCAMWSAEVFEEIDGSLQNVHSAVSRGRMIKCTVCGNRGATVGCNVRSCGEHYHYPCARSIDCAFLTDKSMYCPAHAKNGNALKANGSASVTYESNFEVSRPVYVELDRKRKKLIEPARVQFHIGSLEVRQLGTIVPRFSDSYEAVVPINFLCSRLYWSSKEPWKIVEYTVRTTIQNSLSTLTALDVGRNYTVDHTNPNGKEVQLGLAQIARWHTSLARSDFLENGGTDWSGDYPNPNSCVLPDENTEEEPQQQADLFPPEIKDAIFEDLPHELLDGISMLDIFMYEDLADKTDPFAISEQSKDGTQAMTSNQGQSQNQQAGGAGSVSICDEDTRNSNTSLGNGWPASNPVEDAMLSAARNSSQVQMLKTLAWPKLDGNSAMATAIKRRKLSKNLAEGVLLTLSSQQRSKKEMATVAGVSRRQSISEAATEGIATTSGSVRSKSFTWSAAKRFYEKSEAREEPTKMRIMQMDGVDDSITEFRIIAGDGNLSTAQFTGQVKCDRCQCTYRNYDAFQRHVPSCAPSMSTNESESDVNAAGSTNNAAQLSAESLNELQKQLLANAGGLNYLQTAASFPQVQSLGSLGQFGLQGLQQLQLQPQSLGNGFFLSQPNPTTQANTDELQIYANSLQSLAANLGGGFTLAQPTVTAPAQPQLIAVSTNPDGTQQFIQIPQTMQATTTTPTATYQTLQATNTDKKIMLPLTAAGKPLKTVATKAAQQAAAKQRQLKSAHQVKPIQAKLQPHPQQHQQQQQAQVQQPITVMGQNLLQPQLLFQSSAQSQAPQLILPQAQPQNIISFVTGDGSQGQPLQYISIPTAGDYKPQPQPTATPTFLTTGPGGGATYLQTDASGNLVLTTTPTNSGLQMLTAQSLQAQPQVIGTLIQPQTIQLGGGSDGNQAGSNQQPLILGGAGGGATGLEFATTTPQVILATQPMYYGLETIVQNTVMSSQQFVSTAMPGMLSQNASFSATTTQVFQASKIEPIVDLPAGYVVLNNAGDATTTGTFLNAASVLQQQSQDDATTQLLQNANFQFQTVPTSSGASTSMDYSSPVMVTAKIPPVTQMKRTNAQAKAAGISGVGKVPPQPQVVNKVLPTSIVTQQSQVQLKNSNLKQSQLKGKAASGTGTNCGAPPSIASKPLQKKTNMIRPIHKLEVKPKVMKPTPKMQQQSQAMLQQQQQPQLHQQIPAVVVSQVPKVTISQQRIPAQPQQQLQQTQLLHIPQQQQQQQLQQPQVQVQPSMPIITIAEAPVMQPQFVMEPQVLEQQEMANRVQHFSTSSSSSSSNCSLPTNVVNPMQQQATPTSSSSTTRPTNRVLPMQQRQEPAPLSNECPVAPSPTPPKPVEQPVIQQMNSASASKCYAQKTALPSPVYEAELKTSSVLESMLPVTTMEAIMEEQPATESIYTEGLYEKHSPAEAKTEQLLLQQQQREQLNQQLASNGYLLDKHAFQVEPMETDVYGGEDLEEEDEEDDDFSLKMATSACNDHEMSDSEEPAVKDKISKILDNLTNDDCADSIATATTMEVDAGAGYQQMVEDVLATTAAASAPTEEFEGTLETAAVEAAATYINEMADAHVLELKQLQNGVELELRRRKEEQRTAPQEQEPSKTVVVPTASAPEPPPPIREPKKISGPHLLYEIQSEDGFTYKSSSISEIWEKVFEAVQVARRAHGLTPLPEGPLADMGGIQMIGLKTNALKYLIEQLPGVEKCSKYTPKYHKRNGNVSTAATAGHVGNIGGSSASGILAAVSGGDVQGLLDYGSDQDELQENAFDCARCEPYANRSEYDMFSWLASRHRKQPIQVFVQPSDNELVPRRGTGSNLPMAMKYRTLKETYKDYVGVFRSHIHGRGLYCTKDIEAGEMVIEYAGELIRSTLTDKRERYYDSRGIGCYMFKIDDNLVVDATMRGNAARFINHSCEPNCYSKVVDILGHKHIIIFALRRIVQGEELTYDYKFPFEEEKIPCSCGSKRCRKYLN